LNLTNLFKIKIVSKKRKANINEDDDEESDEEIKKGSKPVKKTKKT